MRAAEVEEEHTFGFFEAEGSARARSSTAATACPLLLAIAGIVVVHCW